MRALYALLGLVLGIALSEVAHRGDHTITRSSQVSGRPESSAEDGRTLDHGAYGYPGSCSFSAHDFYDR